MVRGLLVDAGWYFWLVTSGTIARKGPRAGGIPDQAAHYAIQSRGLPSAKTPPAETHSVPESRLSSWRCSARRHAEPRLSEVGSGVLSRVPAGRVMALTQSMCQRS